MSFFSTQSLTKKFGGVSALSDVTLSVPEGAIMGLIGPNGAGKTTFFNVISGVFRPSSGDFFFLEKRLTGKPPYKITEMGIARTFQNIRVFSGMTTMENVLVARHSRTTAGLFGALVGGPKVRREERESSEKIVEILGFVGLSEQRDIPAESLPYGKQRHVEIARALATEPKLLLLDEPSAGMNTTETEQLMDLITAVRGRGITVLLIEHDMNLVMGICDRIAVLDYGKIIAEGTPVEVRNDRDVIEAYLGREEDYEDLG